MGANQFVNTVVLFVGLPLTFYWLVLRDSLLLCRCYPRSSTSEGILVGWYAYSNGSFVWYRNGSAKVRVTEDGMQLSWFLSPFEAHIPWSDISVYENGQRLTFTFAGVPDMEFVFNKIIRDTMRRRLGRPIPFGYAA